MGEPNIDDTDPIVASYDVYIKPKSNINRDIYVLQFPNRGVDLPYSSANDCQPMKFRTKPKTGMVEIDVPIDAFNNYDRSKGMNFGAALRTSAASKGHGSHGLPGGFGIGGTQARGRKAKGEEEDISDMTSTEFVSAVREGKVLAKQTLGGQMVTSDGTNPQYMVGTFRKNQLHLTPVKHIVQLRPQFHHVDAQAEQKKASAHGSNSTAVPPQARAITMTVKSNVDGENDKIDTMASRISSTQQEPWIQYRYVDEAEDEAWAVFQENFFVGPNDDLTNEELLNDMPKLKSSLDNEEYLDVISAPTDEARLSKSKRSKKGKRDLKGKGKEGDVKEEDDWSDLSDGEVQPAVPDAMEVDS
ncbi:hypothetical protein HYFRA_00004826 [Hymenoscyphus fraxineus]|uniref:DNA-directed RNA polymerase III subunit rpc5 n=1 Tax=Hymenoscyphus fraxineus TaxID=746836 RepID=A0A9N9KLI6_9HELO|nr:hypothetical protein HYFRA_00004826 [Hymenoscyphus fraxineus]